MDKWVWPLLAFVLIILQTTCLGLFKAGQYFDLPLLFVYNMAMLKGASSGVASGLGLGLVQDILSGGVFGFHALTRTISGYACGTIKNAVFEEVFIYHIGLIGIVSAIIKALYLIPLYYLAGGLQDIGLVYFYSSVYYCLGNMLLVLPVGWLMVFINRLIEKNRF